MSGGRTQDIERVGRFRLVGRIAQGGMAEIFLARPEDPEATDAGAEVALKRLLPGLRAESAFVEMFRDEARLAAHLDHPNIVRILEVGSDTRPDGEHPYIAMELLRGVNLRDLLARLQSLRRPIPVELGVFIAVGALRGLAHAHDFTDDRGRPLKVVHRDVSPQNVICTYDGAVKLVDFGVAKAEGRLHRTRAGLIKGKFAYMSPEQVDGGELDGRSDLFALAEVVYELLLRRHPFYAPSDMDVLRKILDEPPPDPRSLEPDFPPDVADALRRALEKRPADRFESAEAMRAALQSWLAGRPRRPTSGELAGFVREAFSDRLREEEQARQTGDDEALIGALRVGRAARLGMLTGAERAPPAPDEVEPSDLESDGEELPTLLFAEPGLPDALGRPEPRGRDPRPGSVRVGPADLGDLGPRVVPSERAPRVLDPAERDTGPREPLDRLGHPERDPEAPAERRLHPAEPAEASGAAPDADAFRVGAAAPRGTTVRLGGGARRAPRSLDVIVFVAGLTALVCALAFALAPSDASPVEVEVRSQPAGARIVLDGDPSDLVSPSSIELPASGSLDLELRLSGYRPCRRTLSAEAEVTPLAIECVLEPEP